ncbi:MAG TPA: PIG-L family deacetylase [Gemmatimonadaceae bacterium]|nr:PIG-L family deacetylase [Gemmatimonadaceae bacterium]
MPNTAGGAWVSPVLQLPSSVPHMWIPTQRESRFRVSRKRLEQILDKLIDGTESAKAPKTVVVVAHPDDEAIGVGARLRSLPDALIVHVTDGAPRDPVYAQKKGFSTREEYARARQDELAAALSLVGVGPERTRCLNVVDGEATSRLVELAYTMADLLDEFRPEVVLTHPYEGGHTDHDATAFAVHLACGMLRREGVHAPLVLEFTSYNFKDGERTIGEFIPFFGIKAKQADLPAELQTLKREMYDCFVSQKECLSAFPVEREAFRPAPRYTFTQAPHRGPLLYERFSNLATGEQWRDQARRALERLRAKRRSLRTLTST